MFTLEQFIKNLAYGELRNISLAEKLLSYEVENHYDEIVSHTQLGLTALHQRFLIKGGQVVIENNPAVGRYYLEPKYAKSNTASTETYKYIIDIGTTPFQDNVLKIEQIYDEVGREFEINGSAYDEDPIFVPEYNCIAMTPGNEGTYWTVTYRADHPPLDTPSGSVTAADIEIQLPAQYREPLQAYVGGRILNGLNHKGLEGQTDGDRLMARYEMLCMRLEQQNMDIDDNETHNKLEENGWV